MSVGDEAQKDKVKTRASKNYDNIPSELKTLRQWVCMQVQEVQEKGQQKLKKSPKDPRTGNNAKSNDAKTWGTFAEALRGCKEFKFDHVAFAFTENDPYCGIDLDKCVGAKADLSQTVQDVLNHFQGTYSEYSTSGKGIHIITKGSIPEAGRKNTTIEIYKANRFFVFTGNILGSQANPILSQQEQLSSFYEKHFKKEKALKIDFHSTLTLSDEEVIEKASRAKNGSRFSALYQGDISAYGDDESSADLALCGILAFYTKDPEQIYRIVKSSQLYRKKWDRKDYRDRTITTALNGCEQHYGEQAASPYRALSKSNPINERLKEDPKAKPIFYPMTFSELQKMPKKEWLVDQVFGPRDLGMVYGPPGCGKTFVVIDLIISACTGIEWATRFQALRPLNVAYCAGEGISGLPSRFGTALLHYGLTTLPTFTFFKEIPQLFDETNTNSAASFITEWKIRQKAKEAEPLDLLVIDTLHTATVAADENSSQDMGKVLQFCKIVASELGCAVLLVHHTNKGGTAERGSSALRGAMDFMLEIKQSDSGTTTLSCSKLKDGEQWQDQPFFLIAQEDSLSAYVQWQKPLEKREQTRNKKTDKLTILTAMTRHPDNKFTCKALAELIAQKPNYTNNLLDELIKEGKCERYPSDPGKKPSRTNSWVYSISQTQKEDYHAT